MRAERNNLRRTYYNKLNKYTMENHNLRKTKSTYKMMLDIPGIKSTLCMRYFRDTDTIKNCVWPNNDDRRAGVTIAAITTKKKRPSTNTKLCQAPPEYNLKKSIRTLVSRASKRKNWTIAMNKQK